MPAPPRLPPRDTMGAWRREARRALAAAGIESAAVEADLLARHVLGLDQGGLLLAAGRALDPPARRRLDLLLHKRLRRFPLQHLTRDVDFFGLTLESTPAALIPRPETEGLVERALAFLGENERGPVLDVGTGTGCIALALAASRPGLEVWGSDVSAAAVRLARRNARRTGLAGRVRFLTGDLTAAWTARRGTGRTLRALVSNPPYVAPRERRALAPEVKDHEPAIALFAAGNGLAVIRRLVREAAETVAPGALLALEIGETHGPAVLALLAGRGPGGTSTWRRARIERDLAGRDRYALAVRAD